MFKQITMYKWQAWAVALLSLGWGCCAVVRWALIVSPSYVAWVDLELWLRKVKYFFKKF